MGLKWISDSRQVRNNRDEGTLLPILSKAVDEGETGVSKF